MEYDKKEFSGGWDADSHPSRIAANAYLEADNMLYQASELGNAGVLKPLKGTQVIPHTANDDDAYCLGAIKDKSSPRFYYFLTSPTNNNFDDCIYEYDKNTNKTTILLSWDGLNFSKALLITGGAVANGTLYWTDNFNQPRSLNITKAKNNEYPSQANMKEEYISLIRRPPNFPLQTTKLLKDGIENPVFNSKSFSFIYQYIYWDNTRSVWSIPSPSTLPNWEFGEKCGSIKLEMWALEQIPPLVSEIRFGVIDKTFEKGYVFKTVKREYDAPLINNHPATPLKIYFTGTLSGTPIPDSELTKVNEYVPFRSKSLETAQNLLFLGNNDFSFGEDVREEIETTLSINYKATSNWQEGGIARTFRREKFVNDQWVTTGEYYSQTYIGTGNGAYYKLKTWDEDIRPPIVLYPDDFDTTNGNAGAWFSSQITGNFNGTEYRLTQVTGHHRVPDSANRFDAYGARGFDIGTTISVGIVFYDRYNRNQGVTKMGEIKIPWRSGPESNLYSHIREVKVFSTVNNSSIIPSWATHCQLVQSRELSKQNPIQSNGKKNRVGTGTFVDGPNNTKLYNNGLFKYAFKNDGGYVLAHSIYHIGSNQSNIFHSVPGDYLAIRRNAFNNDYQFQQGDLVTVMPNNYKVPFFTVNVLDETENYIICGHYDLDGIVDESEYFYFEIYSPVEEIDQEQYYGTGKVREIWSPGSPGRTFPSSEFNFLPDTFYLRYDQKSRSPQTDTDKPYNWEGLTYSQLFEKGSRNHNSIIFSNQFIGGTRVNGLPNFNALNEDFTPSEDGPINKLIVAGRVNSEGTVMLAIGANGTSSIYLGETQVSDTEGTAFFSKSEGVIGTIRPLKGRFGTVNPESVAEVDGRVFFFDLNRAAIVRYAVNGLFPVSNYRMVQYLRGKVSEMLAFKRANDTGSISKIYLRAFGGFHEPSGEYYLTFDYYNTLDDLNDDSPGDGGGGGFQGG